MCLTRDLCCHFCSPKFFLSIQQMRMNSTTLWKSLHLSLSRCRQDIGHVPWATRYLHDRRERLLLPRRLQSLVHGHQVEQLHLVLTAAAELHKHPLEDLLGLVAEGGTEQTQAAGRFLSQLMEEFTAVRTNTVSLTHTPSPRLKSDSSDQGHDKSSRRTRLW